MGWLLAARLTAAAAAAAAVLTNRNRVRMCMTTTGLLLVCTYWAMAQLWYSSDTMVYDLI
jgi:hypothetical protein